MLNEWTLLNLKIKCFYLCFWLLFFIVGEIFCSFSMNTWMYILMICKAISEKSLWKLRPVDTKRVQTAARFHPVRGIRKGFIEKQRLSWAFRDLSRWMLGERSPGISIEWFRVRSGKDKAIFEENLLVKFPSEKERFKDRLEEVGLTSS